MNVEQVNDFEVQPIPLAGAGDKRPVLGALLILELFANIFLCARKMSGKSTVLWNLLLNCVGRDTKILAFCSTLYKDNAWIQIARWCKKNKIPFEGHTSLTEGGVDLLQQFLDTQSQPEETEDEKKAQKKRKNPLILDDDDEEEEKLKPTKYRAPDWIIILDDLSTELKSKTLEGFLKKNRHLKAKVIISSQYLHDLAPESRKQIDTHMIFGGMSKEKIETIYKDADVSVSFEEFYKMYKIATAEKYSFLHIDTRNDTYRIKFDRQFILPK